MKITERVTRTREIHIEPCIKCGSEGASIGDCGYSSFNIGGGVCRTCAVSQTAPCGTLPEKDELVNIWNKANSVTGLIDQQRSVIRTAVSRIFELRKNKPNT